MNGPYSADLRECFFLTSRVKLYFRCVTNPPPDGALVMSGLTRRSLSFKLDKATQLENWQKRPACGPPQWPLCTPRCGLSGH